MILLKYMTMIKKIKKKKMVINIIIINKANNESIFELNSKDFN